MVEGRNRPSTRKPVSYYAPDGDIAYIRVRSSERIVGSREEAWGLRDFDERGELSGIEIWSASERLPRDVLEALPRLEGRGVTIEREPA